MERRRITLEGWMTLAFRLVVGGVFLASSVGKLLEPREEFLAAVRAFEILPQGFDVAFAVLLPWGELLAAVFILLGLFRKYAAGVVLLMLLSFLIAIEHARGSEDILAACGCFGVFSAEETVEQVLFRDAMFFLLAAWLFVSRYDRFALDDHV